MIYESFTFTDPQGFEIYVYKWLPEDASAIKGIVQIAHGMAETAARYERFAEHLTKEGYIVYANDHRGHGMTARDLDNVGYIGEDGFNWMVKDVYQLNRTIADENPGMPIFLFAHSMGSFIGQRYIEQYGDSIKAIVLSGTNGKPGPELPFGVMISKYQAKKYGSRFKSHLMNKLSFGSFNNAIKPINTEFDWLSSDPQEVDKYISDPFCGTVFSASFFRDFLLGLKAIHLKENLDRIPKQLPIYITSGDKDPVGKFGKGPTQMLEVYKALGIKDVSLKLYKDKRHEMLNETNRDEVMKDISHWLNSHI